jgi:hypothetical protein
MKKEGAASRMGGGLFCLCGAFAIMAKKECTMDDKKQKEYLDLLSAMVTVAESVKGEKAGPDGRLPDAEALFIKCFYHSCSRAYPHVASAGLIVLTPCTISL